MGINTRMTKVAAATASAITITWTANEPTAATTQTIADGDVPTVAELGQAVQNIVTEHNKMATDIAALRAALNAGE